MTYILASIAGGLAGLLISWFYGSRRGRQQLILSVQSELVKQQRPGGILANEGRTIRGNGHGGSTTSKPDITPKPQFPQPRIIREDFLP